MKQPRLVDVLLTFMMRRELQLSGRSVGLHYIIDLLCFCLSLQWFINSCRLFGMVRRYQHLHFSLWTLITRFVKGFVFMFPNFGVLSVLHKPFARPSVYHHASLIPRSHPAFRRLQYGKAGEGLVSFLTLVMSG